MNKYPKSRDFELVVQESANELLIYDLTAHKALCLNRTTAIVWQNCDGKTAISEIAEKEKLPEEFVIVAIDELQKADLLAEKIDLQIPANRFSRRKMLMKVGTTVVALPLIIGLVTPTAVQAQSCLGNGATFDLTSSPFFANATACVNALTAVAVGACCSGTLNPAGGFIFNSSPPLCRGFCG